MYSLLDACVRPGQSGLRQYLKKKPSFSSSQTFANLGYVMANVASDGMMVFMAHHEAEKRRGKIQTLIYLMRSIARIFISLVIIFAFSGPMVSY